MYSELKKIIEQAWENRELLSEDPYAEYLDFPEEYRMRDQAQQAEMVYC